MNNTEIKKQIRRLKRRLKRKRSRSTSSSNISSTQSESPPPPPPTPPPPTPPPPARNRDSAPRKRRCRRIISSGSENSIDNVTNQADENNQDDLFSILGEDPTIDKQLSEEIHSHMAVRWNNILQKGIKKENRSDLIKKYLPPKNCSFLKPPQLNDEIKAAVQESSAKRDSKLELKQSQLGAGITCIGRALDLTLKIPDKEVRDPIIKHLSDGGQILTDLHYLESVTRRSLLAQGLNKNTKDAIKELQRDHLLFGESLADKLKAIKACSKSAADIKTKPPRLSSNRTKFESRGGHTSSTNPLNWRGSSRRAMPATANTYSNLAAGTYRERRPAPAAATSRQRPAQTSQRPPQARR